MIKVIGLPCQGVLPQQPVRWPGSPLIQTSTSNQKESGGNRVYRASAIRCIINHLFLLHHEKNIYLASIESRHKYSLIEENESLLTIQLY